MEIKKALDNITDCFTGSDGGVKFTTVKFALEHLEKKAINGDEASNEIIKVVFQFSKLIDLLSKKG